MHPPRGCSNACVSAAMLSHRAAVYKVSCALARLQQLGAPVALRRVVVSLCTHRQMREALRAEIDFVEFYAGAGVVTSKMQEAGLRAVPYDVLQGPQCDITRAEGFAHALTLCMQLRLGGGALLAPPCSSWVWVNRGTSGRSKLLPLGAGLMHRRAIAPASVPPLCTDLPSWPRPPHSAPSTRQAGAMHGGPWGGRDRGRQDGARKRVRERERERCTWMET